MANKNPATPDGFVESQYDRADKDAGKLGSKVIGVRLFETDEEKLFNRYPDSTDRAAFLRSLIHEALNN